MAYFDGEHKIFTAIGCFSTVSSPVRSLYNTYFSADHVDYNPSTNGSFLMPGQCQAFLITNMEFTWFIEQWDIVYALTETPAETPLATFENKKVYPAKVSGLNLPLIKNENREPVITLRWRDELIRYTNTDFVYDQYDSDFYQGNFRPGFGEAIYTDLGRQQKEVTVNCNSLGLRDNPYEPGVTTGNGVTGPLGRLMSIASYVNPELAKQYDTSKNKKKKKSLNEQTYQDPPEYPPYTPYQDNSGY